MHGCGYGRREHPRNSIQSPVSMCEYVHYFSIYSPNKRLSYLGWLPASITATIRWFFKRDNVCLLVPRQQFPVLIIAFCQRYFSRTKIRFSATLTVLKNFKISETQSKWFAVWQISNCFHSVTHLHETRMRYSWRSNFRSATSFTCNDLNNYPDALNLCNQCKVSKSSSYLHICSRQPPLRMSFPSVHSQRRFLETFTDYLHSIIYEQMHFFKRKLGNITFDDMNGGWERLTSWSPLNLNISNCQK